MSSFQNQDSTATSSLSLWSVEDVSKNASPFVELLSSFNACGGFESVDKVDAANAVKKFAQAVLSWGDLNQPSKTGLPTWTVFKSALATIYDSVEMDAEAIDDISPNTGSQEWMNEIMSNEIDVESSDVDVDAAQFDMQVVGQSHSTGGWGQFGIYTQKSGKKSLTSLTSLILGRTTGSLKQKKNGGWTVSSCRPSSFWSNSESAAAWPKAVASLSKALVTLYKNVNNLDTNIEMYLTNPPKMYTKAANTALNAFRKRQLEMSRVEPPTRGKRTSSNKSNKKVMDIESSDVESDNGTSGDDEVGSGSPITVEDVGLSTGPQTAFIALLATGMSQDDASVRAKSLWDTCTLLCMMTGVISHGSSKHGLPFFMTHGLLMFATRLDGKVDQSVTSLLNLTRVKDKKKKNYVIKLDNEFLLQTSEQGQRAFATRLATAQYLGNFPAFLMAITSTFTKATAELSSVPFSRPANKSAYQLSQALEFDPVPMSDDRLESQSVNRGSKKRKLAHAPSEYNLK